MNSPIPSPLAEPQFWEGRICLTYVFSGLFVLDGKELTPQIMKSDMRELYLMTMELRKRKWLSRGMALYIIVPIYTSTSFEESTVDWILSNRLQRWGLLVKPLLYDTKENLVIFKEAAQNDTLLFYDHIDSLFQKGISIVKSLNQNI